MSILTTIALAVLKRWPPHVKTEEEANEEAYAELGRIETAQECNSEQRAELEKVGAKIQAEKDAWYEAQGIPVHDMTTEAGRAAVAKFFSEGLEEPSTPQVALDDAAIDRLADALLATLDEDEIDALLVELKANAEANAELEARAVSIYPDAGHARERAQWIAAQNAAAMDRAQKAC